MIGTILMVAITVVLAAVLYAMVAQTPPEQRTLMVGFVKQSTGQNWTLTVTSVSGQVMLDATTITLRNANGVVMYPLSGVPLGELTAQNWATYKALYQKMKPGDTSVTAGASILIDKATYPQGCTYNLVASNNIIASGAL